MKFRSCKPCVCIATKQIPHDCIFQYKTSLEWYRPLNLCEEHLSGMSEAPSCCQRVPSSFSYTWSLFSSVPWRERFDTATIVPSTVQITSAFISTTQLTLLYISVDKKNQLDITFCILYFSSSSFSTCFGQPCAHHQELTTAWCYNLVLVCAVAAGRLSSPVSR